MKNSFTCKFVITQWNDLEFSQHLNPNKANFLTKYQPYCFKMIQKKLCHLNLVRFSWPCSHHPHLFSFFLFVCGISFQHFYLTFFLINLPFPIKRKNPWVIHVLSLLLSTIEFCQILYSITIPCINFGYLLKNTKQ